jgi:hypothetical protein
MHQYGNPKRHPRRPSHAVGAGVWVSLIATRTNQFLERILTAN